MISIDFCNIVYYTIILCGISFSLIFLTQIEEGEIFATINQKDGMVIFHDDPEKYNSPDMLQRLEYEVRCILAPGVIWFIFCFALIFF